MTQISQQRFTRQLRNAIIVALCTTVAGCATPPRYTVPPSLQVPARADSTTSATGIDQPARQEREFRRSNTPQSPISATGIASLDAEGGLPTMGDMPVNINVQNLPIPVFANEIFGNILGLNLSMEPEVSQLQEVVTFHTTENLRPEDLFRLTQQVLGEYGVSTYVEGDLVQLRVANQGASSTPPLIVSGRALPTVPISHRPIFQLVELEVVRSSDALRWLTTIFGSELKVTDESNRNAVLLNGKPLQVSQALEALRVFDRPLMRGRLSTRLEPAFLTSDQLADRLVEVLNVQGYGASRSLGVPASVLVIPVTAVNSVLVFSSAPEVLEYAVSWARELDRPNPTDGAQSMFYYQVRNTKAEELASVLSGTGISRRRGGNERQAPTTPAREGSDTAPAPAATASTIGASGSLLVDEPRNALIFQGDPADWERMLTLIRQMDRAPRQVMIEVTIAEVTLEDGEEFGVAWFAKNGFGRFNGRSSFGSFPSGGGSANTEGSGLTYLLDVAGQNRFALTAFANDNRVNILSVPRLLVKSGHEANIDIGTEVPTITMTTTSNQQTDGNTNLLQSIQYRKTGIILNIKPTVYSDDRIDLDISQEVSEALPLSEDSTIGSPSIFNRSLNSSLSLRDGGSVVMAGLMSERSTNSDSGVPFLKDVPLLGNLFKSQRRTSNKTELVLMIVPYIIESDDRASLVSQAIIDRLEMLELPQLTNDNPPVRSVPSRPALDVSPQIQRVPARPAPAVNDLP